MPKAMRCAQGHQWESGIGRAGQPPRIIPHCPMCGGEPLRRFSDWQDVSLLQRLMVLALLALVPLAGVGAWFWLRARDQLVRSSWSTPEGTSVALAITPDGNTVVSAGDDGIVRLWSVSTNTLQLTLRGHAGRVNALAFSPDGRLLASAGADQTVRVWDVATGQQQTVLSHVHAGAPVVFAPKGALLATVDEKNRVLLWSVALRMPLALLGPQRAPLSALAFAPDGETLASAGADGIISLWDVSRLWRPRAAHFPVQVGHLIACVAGGPLPFLIILNLPGKVPLAAALQCPRSHTMHLAFAGDNRTLVAGTNDGTMIAWDAVTSRRDDIWKGHRAAITTLCFARSGQRLVSVSADHTVKVWDFTEGHFQERAVVASSGSPLTALALAPDGNFLAVSRADRSLQIWNMAGLLRCLPER